MAVGTLADWMDGAPIALPDVRGLLLEYAEQFCRVAASAVPAGADAREAIDELAHILAAVRGPAALPRLARMRQADRVRGIGYLLAVLIGAEEEIERRHDDAVDLERMLGLRSGHDGGLAEALPLRLAPEDVPNFGSIDDLRRLVQGASDTALELARAGARMLLDWVPLLLPPMTAGHEAKARHFERLALQLIDAPRTPELHATLLISALHFINRAGVPDDALHVAMVYIRCGAADLAVLDFLPESDHERLMNSLPQRRQDVIATGQRLRAAQQRSRLQGAIPPRRATG